MFIDKLKKRDIEFLVTYTFNADRYETFAYNFLELRKIYDTRKNEYFAYAQVEIINHKDEVKRYNVYLTDDDFRVEEFNFKAKTQDNLLVNSDRYDAIMYQMVYRKGMAKLFGQDYERYMFEKNVSNIM